MVRVYIEWEAGVTKNLSVRYTLPVPPLLSTLLLAATIPLASAHGGAHLIELREDGFHPSEITVNQGETVTFENAGKKAHWPASDIHPTHQIYPAFDPKREIPPHGSWNFTFDRAGSWKMHDHLFSEFTGKIVVRTSSGALQEQAQSVPLKQQNFLSRMKIQFLKQLYRIFPTKLTHVLDSVNMMEVAKNDDAVDYWLRVIGPERVMAEMLADSGGGSTMDCHQPAHTIGRIAYKIFAAKAFQHGNPACHSGYYHGAMESFLSEQGTDQLAEKITTLCKSFPSQFGIFECLHGVGHGVLAYENYDLPVALKTCAELGSDYDRSSCYGGLFMENIVTAQGLGARPAHTTTWVSADPLFPCNGIDQESGIQYQCYLMQTSRMLQLSHYDFAHVATECEQAPKAMISVCFRSLGRDIAGFTLRKPTEIVRLCATVPQDYHDECITGAINVIIDFWGAGLENQAAAVCTLLTTTQKTQCYSVLSGRLTDIFSKPADRTRICDGFEPAYQHLCRPQTVGN